MCLFSFAAPHSLASSFIGLPRAGQSRGEGGRDPLHSAPSPREEPPDAGPAHETLGQVSFGVDAPFYTVLQIQQSQRP